jgi:glycerol-3-phosphate dehydrogenase
MLSEKNLGVAFTLDNGEVYYKEELETILNTEMVKSIKDLLLRRTGIGTLGISSPLPFAEEHGHVLLTQPEATLRKAG